MCETLILILLDPTSDFVVLANSATDRVSHFDQFRVPSSSAPSHIMETLGLANAISTDPISTQHLPDKVHPRQSSRVPVFPLLDQEHRIPQVFSHAQTTPKPSSTDRALGKGSYSHKFVGHGITLGEMDTDHHPDESVVKSRDLTYRVACLTGAATAKVGHTDQYVVFWTRVYRVSEGLDESGGEYKGPSSESGSQL